MKTIKIVKEEQGVSWFNHGSWRRNYFMASANIFLSSMLDKGVYLTHISRRKMYFCDLVLVLNEKTSKTFNYKAIVVSGRRHLAFCKRDFRRFFIFPPKRIYVKFNKVV